MKQIIRCMLSMHKTLESIPRTRSKREALTAELSMSGCPVNMSVGTVGCRRAQPPMGSSSHMKVVMNCVRKLSQARLRASQQAVSSEVLLAMWNSK